MLKRVIPIALVLGLSTVFVAPAALAIPPTQIPSVERANSWVMDSADILSPATEQKINSLVDDLQEQSNVELAVVTVDSYDGLQNYEYAIQLADHWGGLGDSEEDTGLIFLISVGDRNSYIAVGYGLEPILTDAMATNITELGNSYYQNGDFDNGVLTVTTTLADGVRDNDFSAFEPVEVDWTWFWYFVIAFSVSLTIGSIFNWKYWNWNGFLYVLGEIADGMAEGGSSGSYGGSGGGGGGGRGSGGGSFGGGGGGSNW